LGILNRFIFAGLVEPTAIHRYTSLMDVLVHLSLREGLPRSVVQGLAAGKPAVGFALDGTPEVIIDGQTGYLCPPRDTHAVAEGVIRLLQHPAHARELGEKGREHVRIRWDWHTMVNELEADYQRLLKQ
jgi:glycosyltransferase involved in cell wall biosynthesis